MSMLQYVQENGWIVDYDWEVTDHCHGICFIFDLIFITRNLFSVIVSLVML